MYRKTPDAAALAVLGLTSDDYRTETVELWPENLPTVRIFAAMTTQWASGFSGPTGLRYEALPIMFEMHGIAADQRREIFDGLRVMELAALREMQKE